MPDFWIMFPTTATCSLLSMVSSSGYLMHGSLLSIGCCRNRALLSELRRMRCSSSMVQGDFAICLYLPL